MQNLESTIGSQYANSPVLLALISSFNAAVDPSANINNFLTLLWDVSTAQGYGLDVWGRIVGVSRIMHVASGSFFGFTGPSGSASGTPFNNSPFYTGTALTTNFSLSDNAFRTLIYAKAYANICDGSIPAINTILRTLFPGAGNCYCTDGQNMTMTYSFHFTLTPVQQAIVLNSGVMPRPCGVSATLIQGLP